MVAVPPSHISKVIYFGTPSVAVPQLQRLAEEGYEIVLVVTKPPKKRGRGSELTPSPVEIAATELGVKVSYDPDEALGVDADLGVVVAYGNIIKPELLDVLPMVNLHFSLLPRWRGAAPVERAIMAGDSETGVALMALDYELDTGAIYRLEKTAIGQDETSAELMQRLVNISCDVLAEGLLDGLTDPHPQVGEPTYAKMLSKEEFMIDFSEPAQAIVAKTRVRRCTAVYHGKRLGIVKAVAHAETPLAPGELDGAMVGTTQGGLELVEVQPESKAAMPAEDWLRGLGADSPSHFGT